MAHTWEYETVKLDGTTLSIAVEGVGLGLGAGVDIDCTGVGVRDDIGMRTATGELCAAGCDGCVFGVAAVLSQPCIAMHPVANGGFCAFIRVEFINVCVTRNEMKPNTITMPSRSKLKRRIPFHFGKRGGET